MVMLLILIFAVIAMPLIALMVFLDFVLALILGIILMCIQVVIIVLAWNNR